MSVMGVAKAKRVSKECTWKNQNSKLMNQQPEGANSTKSYARKQTNKETNRQKHKEATPRHVFWLSHSHHCFLSLFFPFIITSPTFPSYAFFSFPNVPIHNSFWSPFESKSKLKTVLRFKEGTTFAWLLFLQVIQFQSLVSKDLDSWNSPCGLLNLMGPLLISKFSCGSNCTTMVISTNGFIDLF